MTPSQQIGRVQLIARSRGVLPWAIPVLEQICFFFTNSWKCKYLLCFFSIPYFKVVRVFVGVDLLLYTPVDANCSKCNDKRRKNTNVALNCMLGPNLSIKTYSLTVLLSQGKPIGKLPMSCRNTKSKSMLNVRAKAGAESLPRFIPKHSVSS
jgi:hypothetical protein